MEDPSAASAAPATSSNAISNNNGGRENWVEAEFLSFGDLDEDEDADNEDDREQEERWRMQRSQREPQVLPPWMDRPTDYRRVNPLIALHNEIIGFCNLMQPQPEEMDERQRMVKRMERLIYRTFGGPDKCKVEVFGSQATGMCLPTSDIDLVIILKDNETKKEDEEKKKAAIDKTSKLDNSVEAKDRKKSLEFQQRLEDEMEMAKYAALSEHQNEMQSPLQRLADAVEDEFGKEEELSYLEVIENTTVPLVKLTHGPTNISVDICFNREEGVRAATLIKTFLHAMPPLRPLTFVLKYFLAARGMNEPYTGGVGSYMLQLMIVSFLQARERDTVEQHRGHPNLYNLGALLVEFLELYGLDFNYITTGISVRHDGCYFAKGDKDRKEHFWNPLRPFSLSMENPLEPTLDIGKPSFRMQTVQRSFEVAFKILMTHVATPVVPVESILESILPTTDEMRQRATDQLNNRNKKRLPPRQDNREKNSRYASSKSTGSDMDTDSADEVNDKRSKRHRRR